MIFERFKTMDSKELSKEIFSFLDSHAKLAANYDPKYDDPEDRFNGPDSASLYAVAIALENELDFVMPFSSFGSGCYEPISDKEVSEKHNRIMSEIAEYVRVRAAESSVKF